MLAKRGEAVRPVGGEHVDAVEAVGAVVDLVDHVVGVQLGAAPGVGHELRGTRLVTGLPTASGTAGASGPAEIGGRVGAVRERRAHVVIGACDGGRSGRGEH